MVITLTWSISRRRDDALFRLQTLKGQYDVLKERTDDFYFVMQKTEKILDIVKVQYQREVQALKGATEEYQKVWNEFDHIKEANEAHVESLRLYDKDESNLAGTISENEKTIAELIAGIASAQQYAIEHAPLVDASTVLVLEKMLNAITKCFSIAKNEFRRCKNRRDRTERSLMKVKAKVADLDRQFYGQFYKQ